jgi:hypothetical protein
MQKLADNLKEIHMNNENRKYVSNWQETLPPGSLWCPGSRGDPACKVCSGTGWVRPNVYPGNPLFGKLQCCECVPNSVHRMLEYENSGEYRPTPK